MQEQDEKRRRKSKIVPEPENNHTNKEGALDDIISSIRSGKAFGDANTLSRRDKRSTILKRDERPGRKRSDQDKQMSLVKDELQDTLKEKFFQKQDQGAIGRLKRFGDAGEQKAVAPTANQPPDSQSPRRERALGTISDNRQSREGVQPSSPSKGTSPGKVPMDFWKRKTESDSPSSPLPPKKEGLQDIRKRFEAGSKQAEQSI